MTRDAKKFAQRVFIAQGVIVVLLMVLLLVAASCFSSRLAHAATETHWLRWTNPSENARVIQVVDPETGEPDSTFDCTGGGTPLHDLSYLVFYGLNSNTGSLYQIVTRKDVLGREGLQDSVAVQTDGSPWHFFAIPYDTAGNGRCSSNIVYIGTITSVAVVDMGIRDRVKSIRLFDVMGRRAGCNLATGIYFEETTYASGRRSTRKVVLKK